MSNSTLAPFARPLYIMLKPVGALCNLRCRYCYYLDKKKFYPNETKFVMSEDLLEKFIRQYIESQTIPDILFTWHGGEALMRGIDFYRKAVNLQLKYGRGKHIGNSLQTNGTLLNDEWCEFFKKNNFLIGISVDGDRKFHDRYRKSIDGGPSFDRVMKGIELLKRYGVEYNIMGVVNDFNADYPLEFYRFFKENDCHYIQFAPIVERMPDGSMAPWNVDSEKWGDFLIAVFDEWVGNDVGNYYIQYFDSALACWVGQDPGTCIFSRTCGHAGVMEFNGDVYSCDHFVFPDYKLGNIHTGTITEMMYSKKQFDFGNNKYNRLPRKCKGCDYLFACYGECPKNRIIRTENGEAGLNYLCKGYYKYFTHIAPYMDFMKKELLSGRAPANIMQAVRNKRI